MKRLPAAVLTAFALAGCVTETSGPAAAPPDLERAARINTQLASDYVRQGDYAQAEDKARRALEQDEQLAGAHLVYAFVLARRNKLAEASQHYQRGIQLEPDNSDARNQYGVFLCERGQYEAGDREFRTALANPVYASPEVALTNAGVCARRAGKLAQAETDLREALKRQPEYAEALAQIAAVSFESQQWLRARAFLQRYERLGPPRPELLYIAARNERQLGDAAAAQRYEAKLLHDFPESDQAALLAKSPDVR